MYIKIICLLKILQDVGEGHFEIIEPAEEQKKEIVKPKEPQEKDIKKRGIYYSPFVFGICLDIPIIN